MMIAAGPTADPAAAASAASVTAAAASSSASLPTNRPFSFHHRLYEFAKAALIKIFVSPYATVCDLYCGPGADADKWDEAQIGHYIGIGAFISNPKFSLRIYLDVDLLFVTFFSN